MVAGDHAAVFELGDPLVHGRRAEPHQPRELGVGRPRVRAQRVEQLTVDGVHVSRRYRAGVVRAWPSSPVQRVIRSCSTPMTSRIFAGHEVDELLHAARRAVEAGAGGQHDRAGVVQLEQVLQGRPGVGSLAGDDDQRTALFERDVGGALQQVLRQPDRDAGDRGGRGGHDDHAAWPGTSPTTGRRRGRRRSSSGRRAAHVRASRRDRRASARRGSRCPSRPAASAGRPARSPGRPGPRRRRGRAARPARTACPTRRTRRPPTGCGSRVSSPIGSGGHEPRPWTTRSARAKANSPMPITPLAVKNARLTRERSCGRTIRCS